MGDSLNEVSDHAFPEWMYGRVTPMPRDIPTGWELTKLTTVARLESGHTPSRREPSYWAGDIPWVSLHDSKNLDGPVIRETAQTISRLGLANSSARLLPVGTVVLSRTATVGKTTILGREMATSQDFANYVCGDRIHNAYLMQLFRFLKPEWNRLMAGSTHNTVYMPIFRDLMVLLPPLPEQRKIAAILSSVDEAIEKTQAVIDQVQVVKKGLMQELLTRGLPGRHTKFKQTEIGEIPEEWEIVRLDRLVRPDSPVTYGVVKPGPEDPAGILFVRSGDLVDGVIRVDGLRTITNAVSAQYRRTILRGGELLIALVGQPGATAIAPPELAGANIARQVGLLRLSDCVDANFVRHYLASDAGTRALFNETLGSVQQVINLRDLSGVCVPVPCDEEQRQIVAVLGSYESRLAVEARLLEQLCRLKQALMSVLLTGEVRVKVDPEPTP